VALVAFGACCARLLTINASDARAGTIEMTSCSGFGDGGYDTDINGLVWQGVDSSHFSTSDH